MIERSVAQTMRSEMTDDSPRQAEDHIFHNTSLQGHTKGMICDIKDRMRKRNRRSEEGDGSQTSSEHVAKTRSDDSSIRTGQDDFTGSPAVNGEQKPTAQPDT